MVTKIDNVINERTRVRTKIIFIRTNHETKPEKCITAIKYDNRKKLNNNE